MYFKEENSLSASAEAAEIQKILIVIKNKKE